MKTHNNIPAELAPFSKWACKIRSCCYFEKKLDYCIDCSEFPCMIYSKKLPDTHKDDERYHYHHEVPGQFIKMKEMGSDNYITFQKDRWRYDSCGGTIMFYYYICNSCGKEKKVK